jgi:hypothetical protein
VIIGNAINHEELLALAQNKKLFTTVQPEVEPKSLVQNAAAPLSGFSRAINQLSSGKVDLPSALCLGLLIYGIVELARGRLSRLPWYTAFWYASELFYKFINNQSDPKALDSNKLPED